MDTTHFIFILLASCMLMLSLRAVVCAPHCLSGDFHSQLQHILDTQMMSKQEHVDVITRLLHDVQSTLSKRWQDFKLFPFGSISTGLGTKTSDVDIFVKLLNINSSADFYVLEETTKLFNEDPAVYSSVYYRFRPEFTRVSVFHIPTNRNIDLVLRSGEGAVQNSKLLSYYLGLDKRFRPLTGFLKYWFKVHGLAGGERGTLSNYGTYLLTFFYLQQKNMTPPVYVLQTGSKINFKNFDVSFNELPYSTNNTEDLYELLGGFFKYYSEFNFDEYIVSIFAGRPIRRDAFLDVEDFPKEFSLYKYNLIRNNSNITIIPCTDICIQEAFLHYVDVGERISHENFQRLKQLISSAGTLFAHARRDDVLRAILVVDQHNEAVKSNNNAVDTIIGRGCIAS